MIATNPININGQTYDKYSIDMILSTTYDHEENPITNVIYQITPTKVENGVIYKALESSFNLRFTLSSSISDENTLVAVNDLNNVIHNYLQAQGF